MSLNKKLKLKYYEEALVLLENNVKKTICGALSKVLYNYNTTYDANCMVYYEMEKYFPEIYKHKPTDIKSYWFSIDDKESRINILKMEINNLKNPEYILCAATWYKTFKPLDFNYGDLLPTNITEGIVITGYRHGYIISLLKALTGIRSVEPDCGEYVQGFLTNRNRFVDRQEAYKIAYDSDQIIGPNKGYETNYVGLTSEDLY